MAGTTRSTTVFASAQLFTVARLLAVEAQSEPLKTIAAIPLAAAAAEAYVNDLGYWAKLTGHPKSDEWYFAELFSYADEARRPTLTRAELVSRAFKGTLPDRGSTWWQNLTLLFQVRDALMHRRPETWNYDPDDPPVELAYHRLADELIRRKIITGSPPAQPLPLTTLVAQPAVARWAFNTTVTMVHELMKILPNSIRMIVFTGPPENLERL